MEMQELIIALFKEYLIVNKFDTTVEKFKAELQEKKVECTISKRMQMATALNLQAQLVEENEKKKQGQPCLNSTLEILIREFQRSDSQLSELQNQIDELKQEQKDEPKTKKIKVRRKKETEKIEENEIQTEEKQKEPESIWGKKENSIWGQNKAPSKQSNLGMPLKQFIEQQTSYTDFLTTLFQDKRTKTLPDTWYQAIFCLKNDPIDLKKPQTWGIHQSNGGPCGFIATLMCRTYKYLFFGQKLKVNGKTQFKSAVLSALVDTFQVIDNEKAIFILPECFSQMNELNRIVEEVDKFYAKQYLYKDLVQLFETDEFDRFCFSNKASAFVPACVFSFILTRGIQNIKNDYDDEKGSLFANQNNCSQELVNLMICGRAVMNVHDNVIKAGGMDLKGITKQYDIGFLSIYEVYNDFKVGQFYKNPQFPAWVCYNEAHFTCLFGDPNKYGQKQQGKTKFVYFDGLDDQKVLYQINVNFDEEKYKKLELESYVENLITTILPGIEFDWNGIDKLMC